jgi:TP901 family phage tail tape measure protein
MAEGLGATAVINYRLNVEDVKRQVKQLQRLNSIMAKNLGKDFTKGAIIVRKELTKISESVKPITLKSGKTTKEIRTFTTVVRAANGQLATITQRTAGLGKNFKVLNTTIKSGAAGMRTFGQNLATLAKRAALTIPLWFVLRQGIGSVFRTIKEGLSSIVAFDAALQKAKRNLQGTTASIAQNFATLKTEVTKLSIETGRSVEDITNAFQKFATVGFDFETSMAGAQNATKLSILLFGDATETANAFARTMRVLIDETNGAKPASEQLADVMALTAELWETNAFELNEMTASLERFAPAAKVAGFSADEAVKLMAGLSTAGLRGSKAGRLLSTSLVRLLVNTDKLAESLGVKVNPEMDRTFDVFLRTLDALNKTRNAAGKVSPAFEKITKSIFGLRSGLAVKGLIALRKNLQEVLNVKGDVSDFNNKFEEINKTTFQLDAQVKNLNVTLGRAFATGIVGGEDYDDVLQTIINTQLKLSEGMEQFGTVARNAIISGGVGSLLIFRAQILKTLAFVAANPIVLGTIATFTTLNLIEDVIRLRKESDKASISLADVAIDFAKEIDKALLGDLNFDEIDLLIARLETFGAKQIGFDEVNFNNTLKVLKEIRAEEEKISKEKQNQIDAGEKATILEGKRTKIAKIVLEHELKILEARGASTSELLKAEGLIRNQLNIEKSANDQYKDRLELQRAINQEKELESTLSSRTQKLAKIGREEGVQTARRLSEVLSGDFDFDLFERIGGKNLEIFKKEFANIFQEQQDLKFLRGKGFDITPAQRDIAKISGVSVDPRATSLSQRQAQLDIRRLEKTPLLIAGLNANTNANIANTQSLSSLLAVFESTGFVRGADIVSAKKAEAQKIDFNITIDGKNLDLKFGSEKEARDILTSLLSDRSTIDRIVNSIPFKKATDERIDKF